MRLHRLAAVAGLSALLVASATACSAGDGGGADGGGGGAGGGARPVLVTTGVRYATAPSGWADATMDLYVPPDAGQPPVAVIVPDAGADAGAPDYAQLARDLAARGVLSAVVRWGVEAPDLTAVAGREVDDLVSQAEAVTAEVACALTAVAERAGPGAGSPARPFVVVGHGTGANAAAMAALTAPARFPGCFSQGAAPSVGAVSLWDGDWLGGVAEDALGGGAAAFLRAYSPWPRLGSLPTPAYVELGVNANRLVGKDVEVGPTSSYLTTRDPHGSMTRDLEQARAFDDGAVDPVDVTRAFAAGLHEAGVPSRERELHGEGDPDSLGPQVRSLILESVVQLTTH